MPAELTQITLYPVPLRSRERPGPAFYHLPDKRLQHVRRSPQHRRPFTLMSYCAPFDLPESSTYRRVGQCGPATDQPPGRPCAHATTHVPHGRYALLPTIVRILDQGIGKPASTPLLTFFVTT